MVLNFRERYKELKQIIDYYIKSKKIKRIIKNILQDTIESNIIIRPVWEIMFKLLKQFHCQKDS